MKKQQLPKQFIRALVDKSSIKKDVKQFDVVFATETPCFRRGWEENFNEILVCNKENMRTQRLDGGVVPLLDNHDRYTGVRAQYGNVISWSVENNECKATVQFSNRAELQGIWDDIEAGIIRGISASYIPWVYQREMVAGSTVPNYRAIDWETTEISLAPVPFDYNSKVRSEGQDAENSFEIEIRNLNENQKNKMENEVENTTVVEQTTPPVQERSLETKPTPTPAPQKIDTAKLTSEAATAERQRGIDIRTAVRAAKMEETFADELISKEITVDQARAEILNKMAAADPTPNVRTANTGNVTIVKDEVENTREAMVIALQNRAQPGSVKMEGKAHDFKFMSMLEVARHMLIQAGEKGNSYSPSEVVKRAIATTDYANLLTSTVERTIRRTYDAVQPEWKNIARQSNAKDFREKTGIAVDGKVTFEEIAEGGEYKNALLLTDDAAKLKLKTFGRKITITRQAIINDDLSVFDKLPQIIAYGAADFQAAKVWGLITANAKTPDGKALFHVDHKNLAAGADAAVVSEALLAKARTAMFRMKTPAGAPLPTIPKYLIVPMELMTAAEKIMASLLSSANQDVNTMKGKYEILTSPYLSSATEWYLAADTSRVEGLVYAYLEGEEGLFIDKETSFDNDSVTTKARLDFDCQVWDYRGWYKNPGA